LVGLRKGKWREWLWFPPFEVVLNSLRFRLLPKNCQTTASCVALKECQLARDKRAGQKTKICVTVSKICKKSPLW
jgi:hypothetical protein